MWSRALNFLSVLLLLGCGGAETVQAQNLEAGKSASKIFGQTCSACHRSPRGLLKSVPPGALPGFLREHYTTSSNMAGLLADYLISNGAANTRYQTKDRRPEAVRPEGEGVAPLYQPRRAGKKRMARPSEEGASEGAEIPGVAPSTNEPGSGRKARRPSKRGKPNADAAKEAPAGPSADDRKGETNSEPSGEVPRPDSASSVTPSALPEAVPQETVPPTVAPAGPPPSSD